MARRSLRFTRRVQLVTCGVWLIACSFDSHAPHPNAKPVNSAATLSGAGAFGTDSGAPIDLGEGSMSTGFGEGGTEAGENGENGEASAGAPSGGTDSGAASSGSGGIGGATSNGRGGAADAGGNADGGAAGGSSSAGSASAAANPSPPSLFFSEYVEGSSSNKALEICAARDSALDTCKVGAYFNGSAEASVIAVLSGTLAAGHVLTLCTSTLKTQLGAVCDQVGRLTFNGNDAIAISCDGKLLDVIGQLGVDPGAAWGSGATTTADHSLRRKCTVSTGDPNGLDPFVPSEEWQSFPADTFSGLGSRGC